MPTHSPSSLPLPSLTYRHRTPSRSSPPTASPTLSGHPAPPAPPTWSLAVSCAAPCPPQSAAPRAAGRSCACCPSAARSRVPGPWTRGRVGTPLSRSPDRLGRSPCCRGRGGPVRFSVFVSACKSLGSGFWGERKGDTFRTTPTFAEPVPSSGATASTTRIMSLCIIRT